MTETINQIIDIEERATQIINEGKRYSDSLKFRLSKASENLQQSIESHEIARIKRIDDQEVSEEVSEVNAIKERSALILKGLEDSFNANKKKWVEEIWNKILNSDTL